MLTNNQLLEKHFRKKRTSKRQSKRRELLRIPAMTEKEADAWLDENIAPADQDMYFGEMVTPFSDKNWSYGVTLRDGVKQFLYHISKGETVANIKESVSEADDVTPEVLALIDLPDDEFVIEFTKFTYRALWGPDGRNFSDAGRYENHLHLLFNLILVLYLYGPKIFIATLLNGIYCVESWTKLERLSKDWDISKSCGHSVLGYSLFGLILFNPLYSVKTPVMKTSFKSLVSFFFSVNTIFWICNSLANDPPNFNFDKGYLHFFQGAGTSHMAHLYGLVNGATLPGFIRLVEKYVFGQK